MTADNEQKWNQISANIPMRSGKIPDLEEFDASFFGITKRQVKSLHPQTRKGLEVAYETVLDAGVNPVSLKGSRTGVYMGICFSDVVDTAQLRYNAIFGSRSMTANLISYYMDLKGPSICIDTACSSSAYALDQAYTALKCGLIDSAIVGGCNLIMDLTTSEDLAKLGALSMLSGSTPFDERASGYVRAESVSCIFLQRKMEANRIYGYVVHSKTNTDGHKTMGATYPSVDMQAELLSSLYEDLDGRVTVDDLGYFEAHGTSTKVGDPVEVEAIHRAITSKREKPLLIGSVKSNMGHSEGSAAITGMIKVLLALDNQRIPPNLNFLKVNPKLKAIVIGRLKVVVETENLPKQYASVSSFGIGGSNAHILFKAYEKGKTKNLRQGVSLIVWSGRSQNALNHFFDEIEKSGLDSEHVKLIHNIQEQNIPFFPYRGYALYMEGALLKRNIKLFNREKRPLVWVFSAMGAQWVSMGKDLMKIDIFKATIQRCHDILLPKNLNLIEILCSDNKNIFENNLNSFVGITSIQIALINLLKDIEVKPDFIIGHSMGELAAGYADGGLTEEQAILCSYYIGYITVRDRNVKGTMVAVDEGYKNIKDLLPSSISVACHNSSTSCTISGPEEDMETFLTKLKANKIFYMEVPCGNVAYHTKYTYHTAPEILKTIRQIIPNPKERSSKWLSTCNSDTKACSAEYFNNVLFTPCFFEEAFSKLPKDSLTLEIAPYGQLQSIIRNSMSDGIHLSLTNKYDGVGYLFSTLGE